jgi:cytosine deaminase
MGTLDLIVRNCKLRNKNGLWDVGIQNGRFVEIKEKIPQGGTREIDAAGNLVTPPIHDPHIHLDAVLSVGDPRYNNSGTLLEGIQIWGERKKYLTKDMIKKNAIEAIKWEVAQGVQTIRTHADTTEPNLITVEALVEVREEVKDLADIQIVAFPQDGIYTSTQGESQMRRAIAMGADVIGGIPHNEFTREDGVRDVEFAFNLAEETGCLIDIHVDETGDDQSRFIEVMASEAIKRNMGDRVCASHATAMHNYNNDYAFKLIGIIARSNMHIITNPFDNSVLQNRTDGYPRRRGHTRVDELIQRGVNVCIGHDSIMDPWYPMGKGSLLQGANLLMHTAHLSGYNQIPKLFDMVTDNSAKALNLSDGNEIREGKLANFIVLDAQGEMDAIRLESECLYVFRKGIPIVETTPAKRILSQNGKKEMIDFKIKSPL